MEISLSMVISNYHCVNLYQPPNVKQFFPSSRSLLTKPHVDGQRNSKSHQNHDGLLVRHWCSAKLFDLYLSSKSSVSPLFAIQGTHASPASAISVENEHNMDNAARSSSLEGTDVPLPKIDKSGRFCSPRAARELALSIIYASCLEGCDPVRLLDRRLSAPREPGYEFDKTLLWSYSHMSFSGPPTMTQTQEEADQLLRETEAEARIEAEVLSAPPKLVYSKLILRLARKMLVAVHERWDEHVLLIDKVAPANWKKEPAGRILEFSILHLAMSEILVLGTQHPIIINEAVDLAKRFCDGAAPRVINGCLRTFVKGLEGRSTDVLRSRKKVVIS